MKENVKRLLACDIEEYVDDGQECPQDLIDVVEELRKIIAEKAVHNKIEKQGK